MLMRLFDKNKSNPRLKTRMLMRLFHKNTKQLELKN